MPAVYSKPVRWRLIDFALKACELKKIYNKAAILDRRRMFAITEESPLNFKVFHFLLGICIWDPEIKHVVPLDGCYCHCVSHWDWRKIAEGCNVCQILLHELSNNSANISVKYKSNIYIIKDGQCHVSPPIFNDVDELEYKIKIM